MKLCFEAEKTKKKSIENVSMINAKLWQAFGENRIDLEFITNYIIGCECHFTKNFDVKSVNKANSCDSFESTQIR